MRAAIINRHDIESMIMEAGRKIVGTNVSFGYRGECVGGGTGMKFGGPADNNSRDGTSDGAEWPDKGRVAL